MERNIKGVAKAMMFNRLDELSVLVGDGECSFGVEKEIRYKLTETTGTVCALFEDGFLRGEIKSDLYDSIVDMTLGLMEMRE